MISLVKMTEMHINVNTIITIVTKMLTLLPQGIVRIMQLFYRNKNASLHLREIARQAQLHEPSATRFLKRLEEENILHSAKDGNLKKFTIKHSQATHLIYEAFDVERLQSLPKIRQRALQAYISSLDVKPIFAILFGSSAKGTHHSQSDLDILLVTNAKISTENAEKEADALTGIKMSSFQITHGAFMQEIRLKDDKVIQSALATGYPLINHLMYYEVMSHQRI